MSAPAADDPRSRLAAFAALAAVAAIQWASLLSDPAEWRFVVVVAIAVGAATALLALASAPARVRALGTAAIGLGAGAAGLIAIGIPAGELLPGGWDRLGYSIEDGLERLRGSLEYPLANRGGVSSALLTSALPVGLALAALLGFRPGRRPGAGIISLAVLLALFAVPATIRPTAAPLAWGAIVLALVCIWLWAPRVRSPAAIALLGCAGAIAVPAATSLAKADSLIDYSEWGLAAPPEEVGFGWDHSYGPIDWPRTGTTLFEVRSDEARYWRATVLDEFYALGWRRSAAGGAPVSSAITERWVSDATFSVRSLESRLLISPGEALEVEGIDGVVANPDGTLDAEVEPLEQGVEYSVSAYAPEPGARRMRLASRTYRRELLPYTQIAIPSVPAPPGIEPLTPATLQVPLWGSPRQTGAVVEGVASSPYERTGRLARRLTAGQPSAYDAVIAVQQHLRSSYEYSEVPPARRLPIPAFLFRDRVGYCQQFSGAMALMLRMSGIPARVATGFAPGTAVGAEGGTYEVTDLDAHSWVEVYFDRIGWVPFDPTPAAAPAESQSNGSGAGSAAPGGGGASRQEPEVGLGGEEEPAVAAAGGSTGMPLALSVLLGAVALAGLGSAAVAARSIAFRRLPADSAAEAELAELIPALLASGRSVTASLTLLELEERLRDGGRKVGASYARALREARYRRAHAPVPSLRQRRALRRELARRGGPLRYLRLLVVMPPGAPSAPRRRARG